MGCGEWSYEVLPPDLFRCIHAIPVGDSRHKPFRNRQPGLARNLVVEGARLGIGAVFVHSLVGSMEFLSELTPL